MTSPRRGPRPFRPSAWVVAMLILIAGGLLAPGCTKAPEGGGADNPFDPLGPYAGDPFHLRALRSGNAILVQWDRPDHPAITGYSVLHSLDLADFTEIAALDAEADRFLHTAPAPGVVNYYKVQAADAHGNYSSASRVAADSAWAAPILAIEDGAATTPSRYVLLSVRSGFGEEIEIAQAEDFSDAIVRPITPGENVNYLPYDLGPAAANGERKKVYVRLKQPLPIAPAASDEIDIAFSPTVALAEAGPTVASRRVDLAISAVGAAHMRFALAVEDLPAATWLEPDTLLPDFELGPGLAPQTVHAELESDFGFTLLRQVPVVPDDLTDAGFVLAGDDPLTGSATVPLHSEARALWMRFAQQPDLRSVPWQPYADTTTFTLAGEPGPVTVYGQYRNDWADSPIVTDTIILVGAEVGIGVLAPAAGARLGGGTPLLVSGTAQSASGGAPLDSVAVDWGEGFRRADGLEQWSITWPVPAVTAETAVELRARAWAGGEMATVIVPVTVVP